MDQPGNCSSHLEWIGVHSIIDFLGNRLLGCYDWKIPDVFDHSLCGFHRASPPEKKSRNGRLHSSFFSLLSQLCLSIVYEDHGFVNLVQVLNMTN